MKKLSILIFILMAPILQASEPEDDFGFVIEEHINLIEAELAKDFSRHGPDFGFFTLGLDLGIGIDVPGIGLTINPGMSLTWRKDPEFLRP